MGMMSTLLARAADLTTFRARVWNESGSEAGPFSSTQVLLDPATNMPVTPAKDQSVQELGEQLAAILQKLGGTDQAVSVIVQGANFSASGVAPVTGTLGAKGRSGLPPLKWSALKYGLEPTRGRTDAEEDPQA